MPRTKIQNEVDKSEPTSRVKRRITLLDVPDLPVSITIQEATEVAGVGYRAVCNLIDNKTINAIQTGGKTIIPTWDLLINLRLFPESLLEKVYLQRFEQKNAA